MLQGYDLFMLIVLAAAVGWGAWKGFAWQIASLASIVLSYVVALQFRQPVAALIVKSVEIKPPLDIFLAMLVLFLGTSLVVWVCFNLVSEIIDKFKLKEFDHQVGAVFGLAKGVLLCVIITLFAVALASDEQRQAVFHSRSGYYIARLIDKADPVMPDELHELIDPVVRNLEQGVGEPHRDRQERDEQDQDRPLDWSFGGSAALDDAERPDERSLVSPPGDGAENDRPLRPLPSDRWRR